MIDLHIHTNKSDGQYSAAEAVAKSVEKGVSVLAITDHDTVAGLADGEACAAQAGITFVPGIEISVEGNRELHVLGYFIDYNDAPLLYLCENFVRGREQRESRIFEYLRSHGIELTEDQVKRHITDGAAGRPHFARAMVEAGYAVSVQDAFDHYLGTPEFDSVERFKPPAKEGIEVILKAGGVPVLAHPTLLKLDGERLDALVAELKGYGLAGIECYYSTHTTEQVSQYLGLAVKYELIITCGSDFHGEKVKPGIDIGDGGQGLSRRDANEMLERLRICADKLRGKTGEYK